MDPYSFVKSNSWIIKHGLDFFFDQEFINRLNKEFPEDQCTEMQIIKMFHDDNSLTCNLGTFIQTCKSFKNQLLDAKILYRSFDKEKINGIKDKKVHEIQNLKALIDKIGKEANIRTLVDFGGGQGHMAKEMASLGYKVYIIDSDEKLLSKIDDPLIVKIHSFVEIGSVSKIHISEPFLMYSLHACGSLSDCMLHFYLHDSQAKAIINIGCCYNRIEYYTGCSKWNLDEKMAACQNPLKWINTSNIINVIRINFNRSLLKKIAFEQKFEISDTSNIKSGNPEFYKFVRQLEERSGIIIDKSNRYFNFQENERQFKVFFKWWALKAALGQVIEAMIIKERKDVLGGKILEIFDPQVSPRNYAIVHCKPLVNEEANFSEEERKIETPKAKETFES